MAERRRSAHAGDDQNNGGTLSAKKPRDPQSSYYTDQWEYVLRVEGQRSARWAESFVVALWTCRLLCRRNSSRSLVEQVRPVACVARGRTDAISPISRFRWWGDIDSGDIAPCSRCDAASECQWSGVDGDGGMRPGVRVQPSSDPTYPCCRPIPTQARQRSHITAVVTVGWFATAWTTQSTACGRRHSRAAFVARRLQPPRAAILACASCATPRRLGLHAGKHSIAPFWTHWWWATTQLGKLVRYVRCRRETGETC